MVMEDSISSVDLEVSYTERWWGIVLFHLLPLEDFSLRALVLTYTNERLLRNFIFRKMVTGGTWWVLDNGNTLVTVH